ncbi:hypothetical protein, partial [Salmonella sp. SAL4447]|uniref:hypothetical protein n=1 Tax=Salmonella sp. SAL4447 TaxID=3159902 RepID=UPI00397E37C4
NNPTTLCFGLQGVEVPRLHGTIPDKVIAQPAGNQIGGSGLNHALAKEDIDTITRFVFEGEDAGPLLFVQPPDFAEDCVLT